MNVLRQPWLAQGLLEPAAWLRDGGGGRRWRPPSPSAQIVSVDAAPGPSGSLRVVLSDGVHFVDGVLSPGALRRVARRHPSLGTARLRGALVVVERYAVDVVARCEQPTTLDALCLLMRVTAFRYLGCEGASPFGRPSAADQLRGYRDALRVLVERARVGAAAVPRDPAPAPAPAPAAQEISVLTSSASASLEFSRVMDNTSTAIDSPGGGESKSWLSDPQHPIHSLLSQVTALAAAVDISETKPASEPITHGSKQDADQGRAEPQAMERNTGAVDRGGRAAPSGAPKRRAKPRGKENSAGTKRSKRGAKAHASVHRGAVVQAQIRMLEKWEPIPAAVVAVPPPPSPSTVHRSVPWVFNELPARKGGQVPLLSRRRRLEKAIRAREAARRESMAKAGSQ